jgi:hypothetical protein
VRATDADGAARKAGRRAAAFAGGVLLLSLAGGACSSPSPTPTLDATKVLHFENRTSTAVLVEIDGRDAADPPGYNSGVRPCGGKLDLTAGVAGFPASGWVVWLTIDRSGAFDSALAQWTADPHNMPGTFTGSEILWTRGDIATSSLPRWITITTAGVSLSSTPPQPGTGATCGPLPTSAGTPQATDTGAPADVPDVTDPPAAGATPNASDTSDASEGP